MRESVSCSQVKKKIMKQQRADSDFISIKIACCFLLGISFSCSPKTEQPKEVQDTNVHTLTVAPANLPPPIKAKYLDQGSLAPPIVVPLKNKPKVVPAHPNVHPAGTPKVTQIPNDLKIVTIGEDVPLPETIPAKGKAVPVFQPKPVPALASRMRDAAIYNIQHLSKDEGLPFGGTSILEDSKGHIWLGGGGVVRYDGSNFFPFTGQEGIFSGFILMEDSKGNIWFGGPTGGGYYDGKKVIDFRDQEELKNNWWNTFLEDSKGNIWLGTDKGVYRYDGQQFTFFKKENGLINTAEKQSGDFFDNRINAIFEDSRGHFWWATSGSGVLRYDGKRIIHYTKKEGLIDNYIKSILEDNQGRIWLGSGGEGTTGKGISIYNPDRTTAQGLGGTFTNYTTKEGLSGNRITGMLQDDWGNIWLATYDGGLTCYDGRNFIHYTTEEGLSHNSVNSIMIDSKKNIWAVLNHQNGINRFKPNSFRHFTEKQGLSKPWINSFLEDRKGNIWMGTGYGGLLKYDGQNFIHYSEKEDLLVDFPRPVVEDNQGNIWISTRDKGVGYFDGNVFKYFGAEQGFINPRSWYVHCDQQGRIWVNTWSNTEDGRIIRYDPENGQVTHFAGDNKEGMGGWSIFEDKHHHLWFGGKGCVAKYDAINDQLNFVLQLNHENPDGVFLLMEDEKDHLWFSMNTDTRIFKMKKNGDNPIIDLYTKDHGLPGLKLEGMAVDNNQNSWFGSAGIGIGVIPKGLENPGSSKLAWIQYDKADGLKSRSYDSHSSYIDSKNRLWVGSTEAGVTMLDLNTFELPVEAPKSLSLSHINIQQQFLDFGRLADTIYRNTLASGESLSESFDSIATFQNYPNTLNLPYNLNHLTFHFSAIDWAAPHKIRYSYKMEGLDKDWSNPQTKTEADYRNLPYGSFTFKVKAIGEAQVWSEPFEYRFAIRPPWWHTWWAYCLYVLSAVGAVGGYVLRLRRKIKEKQQQLEREQFLNRELQELNIATSRFVPRDFVQILNKDNLKELQLGDQTQATMTVLFADIRDYTSLSEKMTPEQNFKFINAYLSRMGPIIQANGGFICQYYGDGIMALFKDNHDMAVKAAVEMQQALQRYNRKRFARNRKAIQVGIGLNTGQLMLGVIGDEQRYDTSVISDAVNTASRIEGLTKIFGCKVIVSEKTLLQLKIFTEEQGKDTIGGDYRFLGKVKVKGKEGVLKIYDFYDGETEEVRHLKSKTKALFEKALQLYYDRDFGKAADVFKIILEKYPGDVATSYYMGKSVKYIIDGVEETWSGVEEIVSK